jgi:hypothetical protein
MLDDRTMMVLAGLVVAVPLAVLLTTPFTSLVVETLILMRLYLRRRIRNQEQRCDRHH